MDQNDYKDIDSENEIKAIDEEMKYINEEIKSSGKIHDQMENDLYDSIKKIDRILELDYLTQEDRMFFLDQRDAIKQIEIKENMDFEEYNRGLISQSKKNEERISEIKEGNKLNKVEKENDYDR